MAHMEAVMGDGRAPPKEPRRGPQFLWREPRECLPLLPLVAAALVSGRPQPLVFLALALQDRRGVRCDGASRRDFNRWLPLIGEPGEGVGVLGSILEALADPLAPSLRLVPLVGCHRGGVPSLQLGQGGIHLDVPCY